MPVDVQVIGAEDFQRFSRVMKRASPELRKEMFKALRTEVTKPILDAMRSAARGGNGRLGAAAAMATRQVVKDSGRGDQAGVRVTMVRSRMAARIPGQNSDELGWHLDEGSWRHPVYGNRHAWVAQGSSISGWFSDTADRMAPKAVEEIDRVLGEFAERLAAM